MGTWLYQGKLELDNRVSLDRNALIGIHPRKCWNRGGYWAELGLVGS